MTVVDIRNELLYKYNNNEIIYGRGGNTIEIVGASFIADKPTILGAIDYDYMERELAWYKSQSLSLQAFPGIIPQVWLNTADDDGNVNSNYGWLLDNEGNGGQRRFVIEELKRNTHSRRAVAIYTRPSMHVDATANGKQDFICTNTVQYLLRYGRLDCVVQMRSNDAVFGYKYDLAWQRHVLQEMAIKLEVKIGNIYWQVGSLHVYERHFFYLERL